MENEIGQYEIEQLAAAMGWEQGVDDEHDEIVFFDPVVRDGWKTFTPFMSADDDYTVLEWMRKHQLQEIDHKDEGGYLEWCAFRKELCEPVENGLRLVKAADEYQIGDWSRAAITVLQQQEPRIEDRR